MSELKSLCAASGINLHEQPYPYKSAWLYCPAMENVIIFANASSKQLGMLKLFIENEGTHGA